jgi:hypothetical protein
MIQPRCDQCRFWGEDEKSGSCLRYPPVPALDQDGMGVEAVLDSCAGWMWPKTTGESRCGEFQQAVLADARSVSVLGLSIRSRKCMTRLGISTVGELCQRSWDELLECKNFGVTALNEVREKLQLLGLKLRDE